MQIKGLAAAIPALAFLLTACFMPVPQLAGSDSPSPSPDATAVSVKLQTPPIPAVPVTSTTATPTATPGPIFTPSPTATPTPRPAPTATWTPQPTPTPLLGTVIPTVPPTPVRAAAGNLRPTAPGEWESPIIVSSAEGAFENTSLSVSDDYYVSWAVTNEGESDIDGLFFVDLYFDGVMVERWANNGLPAGFTGSFPDWDGLGNRVRLQPGTHMLKLVVDSTRIILETDESDNVYEREFTWEPPAEPSTEPIQAASRLPDLAPYAPEGWDSPLIATSYPGETASGPLSVNVPAYIRFSIINQGLSSFSEDVWVHLYLDGVLVRDSRWSGAMLGQTLVSSQWDELYGVTNVGAGEHTLKLVIDPNNLVKESDEGNNTLELPLTWDTGPVPTMVVTASPKPEAPYPLFLPNLVPGWTHGEDGPIVISHDKGSSLDSLLTVDETPYVDIAVHNQSLHPVEDFFVVELYFDDLKVHTFEVRGGIPPTRVFKVLDWNQLAQVAPLGVGEHTLRMVIDPDDRVWEEFEDDNVYEKTFVWSNGELPEIEPVTYTDEQLEAMLAGLPRLLDLREPALGPDGVDHTADILEIAEAGYYLVTDKSLEDERVAVLFLTQGDYVDWIDDHYSAVFAVRDDLDYPEILRARESFKKANGFKTRRFGKVALVINAERPVAEVLSTLAHELGHLRQDTLNPRQSEIQQLYVINALQEAQAQQFERVFWLSVEEFTGLSLMQYPDYEGFHRYIDSQLERWAQESDQDEHLMGFLLQWLAVLDDPELAHLRNELESTGRLGMESSQELFKYLVDMSPGVAAIYVETRLEVMEAHLDTISAIARERLVTRLHPDNEGPPALTVPGLLVP